MIAAIIIDVILAGLLIAGAVIGIVRGLIMSLEKPIKWAGAIALGFGLCVPVADYILMPMIQEPITNQITRYLQDKCANITAATASDQLPTLIKLAAGAVGVDISSFESQTSGDFIMELVEKLSAPTIRLISIVISFFVLNLLAKLLLHFAFLLIDKLVEDGLLGTANKILGFVLNTSFAFIVAWSFTGLFTYFISLPGIAEFSWVVEFKGGFLYQFFKSINPVDLLLSF